MALNHADKLAVILSPTMQVRCTGAILQYALYLSGNQSSTEEQVSWAKEAAKFPDSIAKQVSYHITSDPNFIDNGSSITDDQLQGIVETAINKYFIVPLNVSGA